MPKGRKWYYLIAALILLFFLLPVFGAVYSVFSSISAAFCHAAH